MENAITDLLDKIVPKLDVMLKDVRTWLGLLFYIAPIALILFGLFFFFLSPPEANHRLGYRSIYGMGSVNAWKFSQKFAGMVIGGLGIVHLIVAVIGSIIISGQDMNSAMSTVITVLMIEGFSTLAAYIGIEVTLIVRYDLAGNLRKRWRTKRPAPKAVPKPAEPSAEKPAENA